VQSSDSELKSTDTTDSKIIEQSDIEAADGWSKDDKSRNIKQILRNRGFNVITDEPPDILLAVCAIIGDDIVQIFTKQSNLNHRHNYQHLKSFMVVCQNLCIQFGVMMPYCIEVIFQCF